MSSYEDAEHAFSISVNQISSHLFTFKIVTTFPVIPLYFLQMN